MPYLELEDEKRFVIKLSTFGIYNKRASMDYQANEQFLNRKLRHLDYEFNFTLTRFRKSNSL